MLLYGNGRPINTNPNKDYRRLVTHLTEGFGSHLTSPRKLGGIWSLCFDFGLCVGHFGPRSPLFGLCALCLLGVVGCCVSYNRSCGRWIGVGRSFVGPLGPTHSLLLKVCVCI